MTKPKLEAVLNPRSKYYDDTPGLTSQLSLLLFMHQRKRRRLRHKRITNKDRQWVLLVAIKKGIVETIGTKRKKKFLSMF